MIFGGIRTKGKTIIKAKKSRNHTELLCKYLKLPIKIQKKSNLDIIQVSQVKEIQRIKYDIPSDISSSAFFIVLTILSKNSKLIIKNVNINPSRIGLITILKIWVLKLILKISKYTKVKKRQIFMSLALNR